MKLSDFSPEDWYMRLNSRRLIQASQSRGWQRYMDLEQPLYYVAKIIAEQDDRFPALLIAWPELVIDSVDDRLTIDGVKLAGADSPDELITTMWKANDWFEEASEGHSAAMVAKQAFILVGPGDDDQPLMTIEYDDKVAVEIDPRTKQPIAGLSVWWDGDNPIGATTQFGELYLPGAAEGDPGRLISFENGKQVDEQPLGGWSKLIAADPKLPSIPVVPMLNRPRKGCGRSDLVALKPIVDGANQFATNMMAAGEHHAVGRKWAVGVSQNQFVDENGEQIPLWKAAMGSTWAVPYPTDEKGRPLQNQQPITLGQFAQSDLRNFHESFKMLAQVAASLYGLPPSYIGYASDNPPSAESILYSLDRLVRRTERRQTWFGSAHVRASRIGAAILGEDPKKYAGLEVKWRNAATPTLAAMMDAAMKGVTSGIIDAEQAWEDLGYSEETKNGLRQRKLAGGFAAAASLKEVNLGDTTGINPTGSNGSAPAGGLNGVPALRV